MNSVGNEGDMVAVLSWTPKRSSPITSYSSPVRFPSPLKDVEREVQVVFVSAWRLPLRRSTMSLRMPSGSAISSIGAWPCSSGAVSGAIQATPGIRQGVVTGRWGREAYVRHTHNLGSSPISHPTVLPMKKGPTRALL